MKTLKNYISEMESRSHYKCVNEWHYSGKSNVEKRQLFTEHPKNRKELCELVIERLRKNNEDPFLLDIDISKIDSLNNLFSGGYGPENDYHGDHYDYLYKYNDIDVKKIKRINLSTWDVSNVHYVRNLFCKCENLEEIVGIENWKLPYCYQFNGMFRCCEKLKRIDISGWKINKEITTNWMFGNCKKLEEIKGIDVLKPLDDDSFKDLTYMFIGCNEKVIPEWYDKDRWEKPGI